MKLTCSCGATAEFRDGLAGAIASNNWQERHAECSRLRAEVDALNKRLTNAGAELLDIGMEKIAAENEVESLRADAARYRWLRDNHESKIEAHIIVQDEPSHDWDAAIDAALAKEPTK